MGLIDLFLVATHGPKMHLTSQGEQAHIKLSPKSSLVDVGYYNPKILNHDPKPFLKTNKHI
jgi:hypothetical protein